MSAQRLRDNKDRLGLLPLVSFLLMFPVQQKLYVVSTGPITWLKGTL
jgi:hypothetical protein